VNKSEAKYIGDLKLLAFTDSEQCLSGLDVDIAEYDEAIADCMGMLDYSISQKNKAEIKFWRQQLQKAKTGKRVACRLIEQNKTVKDLITA
jgi:hypothetical protein